MGPVYLFSIFFDTIILAFHLRPLLTPDITSCNSILSGLMVLDIILTFFIAFKTNYSELALENVVKDEKDDSIAQL